MISNTIILRQQDLAQGQLDSVLLEDNELVLQGNSCQGSFLSQPLTGLPSFKDVVASWNSTTTQGSFIELWVRVQKDGNWSQWFSYGKWTDNGKNTGSIKGQGDDVAKLSEDLITLGGGGEAIQYRVELSRETAQVPSPKVRQVAFTVAPEDRPQVEYQSANIKLDVEPRAQLPVPEIGNIICSPTSVSMVMAYHGHNEETTQVCAGVRDNGANIYGNWSYNAAYAGEKGFQAYIQICNSLEDVKSYLEQGLPVVASVRIKDKEELEGAISPYPAGHLLVITGLAHKDGQDYVLVNDPAEHSEEKVARAYKMDQFNKAWTRKLIYVIKKQAR